MKLTEIEKYQALAIVFAGVSVILGILLFRATNRDIVSSVEETKQAIENCSDRITEWNKKYPSGTAPTIQSQNELILVLQSCGAK
jgi:hypothetical protein